MINPKVELKVMRNLLTFVTNDIQVIELLNSYYYNSQKVNINIDVESIIATFNQIKEKKSNVFSIRFLERLYKDFFPSLHKESLSIEALNNFIKKFSKEKFDWKTQLLYLLSHKTFRTHSFLFSLVLLNFQSYKEYSSFFNINTLSFKRLNNAISEGDITAYQLEFERIREYNLKYHEVSPCNLHLNEIIKIVNQIPAEMLSKFGIKGIYIYGSHVHCKNDIFSDIDFKVLVSPTNADLDLLADSVKELFSQFFDGKIDLRIVTQNMKLSPLYENIFINEILIRSL